MKNIENSNIAIIGLGYVGLPLAIEFSKKFKVIGFDLNKERIRELKNFYDHTNEVDESVLRELKNLKFSHRKEDLKNNNIYIITVPTPVDRNNVPDLRPLKDASKMVGSFLKNNSVVIFESTVYPGCTEEVCVPLLEKFSNLRYNFEFFCGYSPERINPGDKDHTLTNIKKITSGSNLNTAVIVDDLYNSIIKAGTYKAESIKVAEAAKVIENTQRDVNIALINELSMIFDKMDIDTSEVLEAASSKWNFLPFQPGLVGGHCIGVDPYYLTYKSVEIGYIPEMILSGRRINDNMGAFIAEKTIMELGRKGKNPAKSKIAIFGFTFKENCPDIRNTKVIDIVEKLEGYNCNLTITDCYASYNLVKNEFGINLVELKDIKDQDVLIFAVAHDEYLKYHNFSWQSLLKKDGLIIDIKSIFNKNYFKKLNIRYWRL